MITGGGGKASPCDGHDIPARFYHLAKLVHVATWSCRHSPLVFGAASPDDGSWSLKKPSPIGSVPGTGKQQQKRPGNLIDPTSNGIATLLIPSRLAPAAWMSAVKLDSPIVIVGAGCFGLSTAYHLLKRGFTNVTVLDRAETLPARDAASTDLNKSREISPVPLLLTPIHFAVVRSSYPDDFYTSFAQDAVKAWKDESEWGNHYHEFASLYSLFSGKVTELWGYGMLQGGRLSHGKR